ncbi:hypothetical protein N8T08_011099 [Aspergillus melleus]|uniref:Uncharacterized protein n=1 Tax=Aspergillus melleus TaxID=138277 RepID=A0ACC3AQ81_9EURO|nr:hypothetical protein N8T08_011099 [Aspergillus melleus]
MLRDVEDRTDGTSVRSDRDPTPEKRRETADPEEQTTVLARVISTVDQVSQTSLSDTTATARPTKTSDVESDRSTTSHTSSDPTSVTHSHRSTADNTSSETSTVTNASSSSSSSSSDEGLPTASPAYSSPTADTPTMTTGHDASTTGTSITSGNSTVQLSTQTSHPIISPTTISASSSHRVSSSSAVSTASMSTSSTSNSTIATSSTTSSVAIVWTTSESTTTTSWSSTSYGWGGGESSATSTTTSATPTSTEVASGGSGSLDSRTKGKIAGGVVGGVAGALILLLVAFLLFRRRKAARTPVQEALPAGPETGTALGAESVSRSAEMTSRRSSNDPLFTASYFAPAFMKRWRQSNMTTRTDSTLTSSTSERGFQKISGRKIPSVLQSGGDGYGGGFEAGSPTTSEPSTIIPPPSPVYPRSPTQPPPSVPYGMPLDTSYTREAEESDSRVIFRPSPARTPVAGSASASLSSEPTGSRAVPQVSGALSPTIPKRPDMLGRSHPSFDGSRGSRFSENL